MEVELTENRQANKPKRKHARKDSEHSQTLGIKNNLKNMSAYPAITSDSLEILLQMLATCCSSFQMFLHFWIHQAKPGNLISCWTNLGRVK